MRRAGRNLRLILAALRLYCARMGLSVQAALAIAAAHAKYTEIGFA